MSEVIRVFVEKRPGFDGETRQLREDLRENLGLAAVEDVRLVKRSDLSGLSRRDFAAARASPDSTTSGPTRPRSASSS